MVKTSHKTAAHDLAPAASQNQNVNLNRDSNALRRRPKRKNHADQHGPWQRLAREFCRALAVLQGLASIEHPTGRKLRFKSPGNSPESHMLSRNCRGRSSNRQTPAGPKTAIGLDHAMVSLK